MAQRPAPDCRVVTLLARGVGIFARNGGNLARGATDLSSQPGAAGPRRGILVQTLGNLPPDRRRSGLNPGKLEPRREWPRSRREEPLLRSGESPDRVELSLPFPALWDGSAADGRSAL